MVDGQWCHEPYAISDQPSAMDADQRQNRYFSPSCTCRAVVVVAVMRPNVGDTSPAAFVYTTRPDGTAKFARSNRLNTSSLTCSVRLGGRVNPLTSARSELTSRGPVSALRGMSPRVFAAGIANALMFRYPSGLPMTGSPVNPGFQFGRSFIEKLVVFRLPDRLKPRRIVNGCPL